MNEQLRRMTPLEALFVVGLGITGAIAAAVTRYPSQVSAGVLVLAASMWPLAILAPLRWQDRVDAGRYMAAVNRLAFIALPPTLVTSGFAISAARPDGFPVGAFIMLVAGLAYVVVRATWRDRSPVYPMGAVAGLALGAGFGMIADGGSLGWGSISFGFYGATAFVVASDLCGSGRTLD